MNPVPIMQLVELIRGIATDEAKRLRACQDCRRDRLGKIAAHASEDFPAFIVNRILMPMINEAIYTLYEGVGSVQSIDTSLKRLGANHPDGAIRACRFYRARHLPCDHERAARRAGPIPNTGPCPLLTKYVEAGWLGSQNSNVASTTTVATFPCRPAKISSPQI